MPDKSIRLYITLCVFLIVGFSLFSCVVPAIRTDLSITSTVTSSVGPTHTSEAPSHVSTPTPEAIITGWLSLTPGTLHVTQSPTNPVVQSVVPIQVEESIPICQNAQKPASFSNLPGIVGKIFYASLDQTDLFSFSGVPPQATPVAKPKPWIDSYAFSEDGRWLLAYSKIPEILPTSPGMYSIILIDKDGNIQNKVIDLTRMTEFIHKSGSDTFFVQRWQFKWVDSQIVQVATGYGETSPHWYLFGYYDIFQDTWWEEPLQNVPNRNEYDWTDISPDYTRLLYINNDWEVVLWDLEKQQELWRGDPGNFDAPPLAGWTSDSQKVAFWSTDKFDEIQLLRREGEDYTFVRKPSYPEKSQNLSFGYRGFRWSPDNHLLAISGIVTNNQNSLKKPVLYVYEPESETYVFRCPAENPAEQVFIWNFFWSPDGSMLVPEHVFEGLEKTPFRLYDIKNQVVYQLEEMVYTAIGWVEEFTDSWK